MNVYADNAATTAMSQVAIDAMMPYFNKIYESFDYLVDIMDDVDYERVFNEMNGKAGIENTRST